MNKNNVTSFDHRFEVGNAPPAFALYGDNVFMFNGVKVVGGELYVSYYRVGANPANHFNDEDMTALRLSAFYATDHRVSNAR